jgi:hypothetical protein
MAIVHELNMWILTGRQKKSLLHMQNLRAGKTFIIGNSGSVVGEQNWKRATSFLP